MAWHATPEIIGQAQALYQWKTVEYFIDLAQGVCALYLELPQGKQVNTNTLTDALVGLGLGSVTMDTFPKDGNKAAAAALFRMRNIAKKSKFVMGNDGDHDASLWQQLDGEFKADALKLYGRGGGGGAASAEETEKIQAAMKLSIAEQTERLQGSMAGKDEVKAISQKMDTTAERTERIEGVATSIREAAAGIHEKMASKEDTEALEKQVVTLKTNLDSRDALVRDLTKKNDDQRRMLGDMRKIQTQLARAETERDGFRTQLERATEMLQALTQQHNDALQALVQQHNGALQLVNAAFVDNINNLMQRLATEREARTATANELRATANELRGLQHAEAQWEVERARLVAIASDNREAIARIVTDSLLGKRAQPEADEAA